MFGNSDFRIVQVSSQCFFFKFRVESFRLESWSFEVWGFTFDASSLSMFLGLGIAVSSLRFNVQVKAWNSRCQVAVAVYATTQFRATRMPRAWCRTPRARKNIVQNEFRSFRCFFDQKFVHTSTWTRKDAQYASSFVLFATALFTLRTTTCPERRQVRCWRTHLNSAALLI